MANKTVHHCKISGCPKRVAAAGYCKNHLPRLVMDVRPQWTYENEKGEEELAAKYGRNGRN
jgi:hypothetical protein